ncbi:MAG: hypothetical protein CSB44_09185 [Gammaproteobacteria bacterium]|nr:MAG: hypothetical protein CSB44_09185 [Gammaproteobacteria bacterium]
MHRLSPVNVFAAHARGNLFFRLANGRTIPPPRALSAKALAIIALSLTAVLSLTLPGQASAAEDRPRVMLTTSEGNILLELDPERAPETVKNFLTYVSDGFYDDTIFHRVIEGFMIQGGGFTVDYERKRTRAPISNEAWNGLSNRHYSVAMARTNAPHSANSQFFINVADNTRLDHTGTNDRGWGYAVFGQVIEGQEVVERISQMPTGRGGPFGRDVPKTQVVITSATLLDADTAEADATDAATGADDISGQNEEESEDETEPASDEDTPEAAANEQGAITLTSNAVTG